MARIRLRRFRTSAGAAAVAAAADALIAYRVLQGRRMRRSYAGCCIIASRQRQRGSRSMAASQP